MNYLVDYTVEIEGEIFTGTVLLPDNQMPEAGDIIRLQVPGRELVVRVSSVRLRSLDQETRRIDLLGSVRKGVTGTKFPLRRAAS
jgi:hypothetical protein